MTIRVASTAADWQAVEELFREYISGLPFELDFQDVDNELANLAALYGEPDGIALLAYTGRAHIGVVGVCRFSDGSAELKRMYVRRAVRGRGFGRALAERALAEAQRLGYERLLLDTVESLTEAISLYRSLGFAPIDAYRHNPRPDARYYELVLEPRRRGVRDSN